MRRERRKRDRETSETVGPYRSQLYSIPYYLHVGNFAVPCIVDRVHKRINMLTRETHVRTVRAETREPDVKFQFRDFLKGERRIRGIGDTPNRFAHAGLRRGVVIDSGLPLRDMRGR